MNRPANNAANHLFVFLEIFAREGGIQSYVKDIFRAYSALADRADNSETISAKVLLLRDRANCDNPFASPQLQFEYFSSSSPAIGRVKFAIALLKTLLLQRPQRLFCGHINLAPLVQAFCRPLGIPYTVLTYGKEVWEPLPASYRAALQQADNIWSISRYSRDRTCTCNQIASEKVQLLPCVVDDDVFTPGSKSADLIQRYQLENAQVLMTVARLWSGDIYKGVDVTIRALPQIAAAYPQVKYLVIGRGDDQPRLAQLANDLGIADRVVFAGFVPTKELIDHYRTADAYIMPSQEGFGIVYLEAMACGIPVLSGDADGSADPLQDGRLGWRVPHRDPDAVAAACLEILAGTDQRCNGNWLREEALKAFSFEAITQQLNQLLSKA